MSDGKSGTTQNRIARDFRLEGEREDGTSGEEHHVCGRKRAYPCRKRALTAAHAASRRTQDDIVAYHCPYCHQWHIGHRMHV